MTENDNIRRQLDMLDTQLCALLAKREELAGSSPAPDRRRLAAVRRVEERFGSKVAEAYRSIITGGLEAPAHMGNMGDIGASAIKNTSGKTGHGNGHRIIDITRELLTAPLYPGDPAPSVEPAASIAGGDNCNVSRIVMGSHTGTHMDAPLHFIPGGRDITEVPPEKYIGKCTVADWETFVYGGLPKGCERLLIKGEFEFMEETAGYAADIGLKLIGVEGTSVGGEDVHKLLLGEEIVLLESIDLSDVEQGEYFLFCAPLKIAGCDGAPCRAFLIER